MPDYYPEFDVSKGATYAILFSVLGIFTLLAIASADYFSSFLPSWLNKQLVLQQDKEVGGKNSNRKTDFFLSARDSASATEIALSFFASGMGAWVIYGPTELGAIPNISWIGVIGYAFASSAPAWVVFFIGPTIKARCKDKSFNFTDFGRERYGRVMQVVIASISVFYMFIYLVAELTSISNIYALVNGQPVFEADEDYTISIAVSCGIITIFYTSIGGVPASLITDKFQSIVMIFLVLLLIFAVSLNPANQLAKGQFAIASNWTSDGLMAAVTLIIAVMSAEMFNLGTWQRVWAAKNDSEMKKGFALGSVLVFLLIMFFGIMGMVAYALDPESYNNFDKLAFLAFFDILEPLAPAWHVITLILITSFTASSIDSLQNALMSTFSTDLVAFGWNPKWVARGLIVVLNVPAIIMSAKGYEVIELFLIADLVCATAVLPVFFGLITEDKMGGLIVAPTELGAVLGVISGIVTVCVNGVVNNAKGGVFEYFWLRNGSNCALCGSKTMVTFIITPLFAGFFCMLFSKLDILIRGESARTPLLEIIHPLIFGTAADSPDAEAKVVEVPMENDDEVMKDDPAEKETVSY